MKSNTELLEIVKIPAPSGNEQLMKDYLIEYGRKKLKQTTVYINSGEVYFLKKSKNPQARSVLFDAHIDNVSLRIMTITHDGFLICRSFGLNNSDIYGKPVKIMTKNGIIDGVISINPPHLNIENSNLLVDIFVSNKAEAKQKVEIGDSVFFEPRVQIINGFVNGTNLDNHVGVYTLLQVAQKIDSLVLPHNIIFHFSSREETGGLKYISMINERDDFLGITNKIDLIFVIDTDLANDSYNLQRDDIPETRLQKGPIISRNINDDPFIYKYLMNIIGKIPYQLVMSDGDDSGNNLTDYSKLHALGQSIGIPLRYMHSSIETCHIKDIDWTVSLLFAIITNLQQFNF
jgi:putative aminopeptidase FrvX